MQSSALRYFLEVARTGSVNAAAQKLRVAASAVSRQIVNLERELETDLFERRPRGMVPTQAGTMLAAYAQRLALESDQVIAEIRELSSASKGLIRLGVTEGFAVSFIPELIHLFRQRHTDVCFELTVLSPQVVSEHVRNGAVDIGATFVLQPERGVTTHWQRPVPTYAFVACDHPLLARETIGIEDIFSYPIVALDRDATISRIMDMYCSARGLALEPALVSTNVAALLHFCSLGGGVMFGSSIAFGALTRDGKIVALPISDAKMPARSLQVQTMSGRVLPRLITSFIAHIGKELERFDAEGSQPADDATVPPAGVPEASASA